MYSELHLIELDPTREKKAEDPAPLDFSETRTGSLRVRPSLRRL